MPTSDLIVIAGAARTPIGAFQGALRHVAATELGAAAIRGAVARAGVAAADVDEVLMGCVLPAGLGQAPARQAAMRAGLPEAVPCTTINKVCGSGMKAAMLAVDMVAGGSADVVVAGGMESMSNAPYLLEKARSGYRLGHDRLSDHMLIDGLEDAYDSGRSMGSFAEDTAQRYRFTREAQDYYALTSLRRARDATARGSFRSQIVAVDGVAEDEQPNRAVLEKIPLLRPAFRAGGSVTAASSSSIADGGAALVIARLSTAKKKGMTPWAFVKGHVSYAHAPAWFTTAPAFAIRKLLDNTGWSSKEVDLFEINEAFAVVAMAAAHDLDISSDRLNVNGGACALGHPIGCSGARIIVTLLSAMMANGARRGVASLCIGGGEATALALELV